MRCFLPINNTNGINLCIAAIEVELLYLVFHFAYLIALKKVLYIEKLVASQQTILNRSVITQKRSSITITINIRLDQIMNKLYNAGLLHIKIVRIMINM